MYFPFSISPIVVIRWTRDGRWLFVQHGSDRPTLVEILDVTSGERRPWMRLTPPEAAGILVVGPVRLSADGKAYVYSYRRILDDLYVADGLR